MLGIAGASIMAKVKRDQHLVALGEEYLVSKDESIREGGGLGEE